MHPIIPLLQLLNIVGRIDGRKRLQKMVHILQELGADFQERFQYSFYGMYSLQLKTEIDVLKTDGLVEEYSLPSGAFGVRKTEELSHLLENFSLANEPSWAVRARYLNGLTPHVLEGISTILYLRRTGTEEAVVRDRLLTLKPHLSYIADECFERADKLLAAPITRS